MATRTKTSDPVQDARDALAAATAAEGQARRHLTDLETRIVAGDLTITADEHAEAERAVRHAELQTRGAQAALQAAEQDARRDRLQDMAARYLAAFGTPDEALTLMRQIEDAATQLVARMVERNRTIERAAGELRAAGVPYLDPHGKPRTDRLGRRYEPYKQVTDEHAFLGWREPGMGRSWSVTIGDREVVYLGPGLLLAAAIERACRRAGTHPRLLDGHLQTRNVVAPLAEDPASWLNERY